MLEVISNLVVGNRVYLSWQWDGHLRINQVDIIVPPEESGTFEGYLLDVGDKWIDVQNFNEGKPWRFYLPWIGGYPQGGGGYDREMLKFFHDHNPKIPVYFDWRFDLRPRITRIVKYEEAKFVPFFVGKEEEYIRRMTGEERKKEQAPTGNPFEQAPTGNPFEQAPTGNPFEQAPTGNPFEQAPTGNPFEQAPTGNPFEQAPTGNPFEQAILSSRLQPAILSSRLQPAILSSRLQPAILSSRLQPAILSSRLQQAILSSRPQPAIRSRICPYLSKLGCDFEKLFILCDRET